MLNKDPTAYSLLTYAWVTALSVWGGFVNFYQKVKAGTARPFNIVELIGELATSGLVGLITFFLCESAGINQLVTAALVAISGHMGTRAILIAENWASRRFGDIQ